MPSAALHGQLGEPRSPNAGAANEAPQQAERRALLAPRAQVPSTLPPLFATGALFAAYGFGWGNWWARLPGFKEQLGASDQAMGVVLTGNAAGNFVALPAAATLHRALGPRGFAWGSSVAFAGMLFVAAQARSTSAAAATQTALGAASALMNVAINTQGTRLEAQRAQKCMSTLHAVFSLGALLGSAAGASATKDLTIAHHMALTGLALGVVACIAAPELLPREEAHAEAQARAQRRPTATLLLLGALAAFSAVGEGALNEWTGIYLRDELRASLTVAAAGSLAYQAAMVGGRLVADPVRRHVDAPQILAGGGALTAVGLGVGLAVNSVPSLLTGTAAAGLGLSALSPVLTSTAGRLYPDLGPAAIACVAGFGHLGFFVGPPFIGLVAQHVGLRLALGTVVAAGLVKVSLAPWLAHALGRAAAEDEASASTDEDRSPAAPVSALAANSEQPAA